MNGIIATEGTEIKPAANKMKNTECYNEEKNFNRGLRGWTRIITLKEIVATYGCFTIQKQLGDSTRASAFPFIFEPPG